MLHAMHAQAVGTGYGVEIKKALVARLAAVALEQQDTSLARRLVESTGTSQALGDAAAGLEELASSGGAATGGGRTNALFVSPGQTRPRGRAVAVFDRLVDAPRLGGRNKGHGQAAADRP